MLEEIDEMNLTKLEDKVNGLEGKLDKEFYKINHGNIREYYVPIDSFNVMVIHGNGDSFYSLSSQMLIQKDHVIYCFVSTSWKNSFEEWYVHYKWVYKFVTHTLVTRWKKERKKKWDKKTRASLRDQDRAKMKLKFLEAQLRKLNFIIELKEQNTYILITGSVQNRMIVPYNPFYTPYCITFGGYYCGLHCWNKAHAFVFDTCD
ncbi:putative tripeptidyl-peptidase II [Helianthus anomalus]